MQSPNKSFGLLGYPLGHSYSKIHFTGKFEREGLRDFTYENFEIQSIEQIGTVIHDHPDLVGLNVTIPYKQKVLEYLDEIDPVAGAIGAVNTIKIFRAGNRVILKGYNTDVTGFIRSIASWKLGKQIKALVFGTGGSSLAIKYALGQLGIGFIQVSRSAGTGHISYEEITPELAAGNLLWVNCTPVGMHPDIHGILPLPFGSLTSSHYLFDLVYNPPVTEFLRMGTEAGASTMNGSKMLFEQAEASWEIWTG